VEPLSLFDDLDKPVAVYRGEPVSRRQFWADVFAFGQLLKDAPYVINDCSNRYAFLVSFVACLVKGQVSLFPSSRTRAIFEQLQRSYGDVYCISDQAGSLMGVEVLAFDTDCLGGECRHQPVAIPAEQAALIAFTSGTTGEPKAHVKSWGGFLHEARVAGLSLGLDKNRVGYCLATIPAQHMYGFIASIMVPLCYGISIVEKCPFYPEDIRTQLSALDNNAMLVTTPIQLRNCVHERPSMDNLSFILSSAAPLERSIAEQAEQLFDVPVYEFYGSTETGAMAFRETCKTEYWTSFEDIGVAQKNSRLEVNAPYFTEKQIIQDYVDVLDDRRFIFRGRSSEVIKVSGKRTSLHELNGVLWSIDGVRDGTFYQLETELGGRLMLFAVVDGVSRENLLQSLKGKIDAVFMPRKVIFLESLPRSESGKLPLKELQALGRVS